MFFGTTSSILIQPIIAHAWKKIVIKKKSSMPKLLEGKRQTIESGDWLREVAEIGTEWVSEWASQWRRKYGLILDTILLSPKLSPYLCICLVLLVSRLYPFSLLISMGVIRDHNSYLTSMSIKASALDKLKNVNKKTKQPSERATTKRNTHDSCRLILFVVVLPNTSTSIVLFYIEYRYGDLELLMFLHWSFLINRKV